MIYLASPFTASTREVMDSRYLAACKAAARLMQAGNIVFSPIAHGYGIHYHGGTPCDFEFWRKSNFAWLDRCDIMAVLKIEGWDYSAGVLCEITHCEEKSKPIIYLPSEWAD